MIRIDYATMQAALQCVAKNDARYYLKGVLIDTDGTVVATDGAIMFVGKSSHAVPLGQMLFKFPIKPPAKYDHVLVDHDTMTAKFITGESSTILPIESIDGKFPDYKRLVNSFTHGEDGNVGLNAKYLTLMGKIGKLFNGCALLELGVDATSMMRWKIYQGKYGEPVESAQVYLMPCRM